MNAITYYRHICIHNYLAQSARWFQVRTRTGDDVIGRIEWYPRWRQWILVPEPDVVWSAGCLTDIAQFITLAAKDYPGGGRAHP